MRWSPTRNALATAFIVSLFVIAITGYLSLNNLRMMKSAHYSSLIRGEVIDQIDRLLYAVKDAEANSRAYAITGNERFLRAFNATPAIIDDYRGNLGLLLAGEKKLLVQLLSIDTLIARKMELMRSRVHTMQTKGFAEARQMYATSKSVILMDEIADVVRSVEEQERILQREDDKRLEIQSANDYASDALLAGLTTLGVILFFVVANREMTRRAASDKALEASEVRFRSLIENSQDGVFLSDLAGTILYASPSGESMLGRSGSELVGCDSFGFIHQEDVGVARLAYSSLTNNTTKTITVDFRISQKDGSFRWVEVRGNRAKFGGGQDVIISNYRDVTERKMADQQLQHSEERYRKASIRLRWVSNRLLDVQETERHRLALELHDEIGQLLTAVQLNLEAMRQFDDKEDFSARLNDSTKLIEQLVDQIRNISLELRPSLLDRFGLARALRWYVDRQSQRGQLKGEFVTDLGSERYPSEVEITCFRIAQEALTNILRHAHAKTVNVALKKDSDGLIVTIADDGIGFDTLEVQERKGNRLSFGVLGMRERTNLIGGRFDISSAPGGGTRIEAHVPINVNSQAEES